MRRQRVSTDRPETLWATAPSSATSHLDGANIRRVGRLASMLAYDAAMSLPAEITSGVERRARSQSRLDPRQQEVEGEDASDAGRQNAACR